MDNKSNYKYLLSDLTALKGVGVKTTNLLKKKKINNIFDLLWKLPKSYTDRSLSSKIKDLRIGEVQTITIIPKKYSFPRVRNLPNRVLCSDETGEIDCIFFNSFEGYVRKILPIGKEITVSGKIGYFRNKYQLTNPKYLSEDSSLIKQKHNTYSLTDGITEKIYNKIINQIIENLPLLNEWHSKNILQKFDNISWNDAIKDLHKPENVGSYQKNFYQRLAFDEIFSTFLVNSEIRKKIKKIKKINKILDVNKQNEIINKLKFSLTNDQLKTLKEINNDLCSSTKMFRLLQGDVGSGKTIVSLLSALNTVNSGFQVALMAPTEILARQHYTLAKEIFPKNINIIDDPLVKKSLYSSSFDSEGVKSKKINLVKDGVLSSLILNTYYSKMLNLVSNGRAGGLTNTYFNSGNISYDNLFNNLKTVILITDIMGSFGNPITGDFSCGATGIYFENNESYPINNFTLAGKIKNIFKNIVLANDLEFKYSKNCPTALIQEGLIVGGV